MTPADQVAREHGPGQPATPRLEDLIPIAVVIAAGCETCADRMVRRAVQNGSAKALIERTLGIVAHLRSTDCLAQAVGQEVTARMEKPLEAGRKALRALERQAEQGSCCGPKEPAPRDSRKV